MPDHNYFAHLIWQIADLLRGPYRPPQYERVMLPMTVLRRFDCVLAPTKAKVLAEFDRRKGGKLEGDALDSNLNKAAGQRFHNHSPLDFAKLKGDPDNIEKHLVSYIKGFSKNVRDIFDFFEFENEIERMREANILFLVVSKFCDVDLHPNAVPNEQMGLIFENLIRRFNELANETAGDHFTPREVIRLMVNILFIHDDKLLATAGTVRKLLDPACGTGGMLAEAQNYLREHHGAAKLYVYGQDYNKRAFATAASDMLMKQVDHNGGGNNVRYGDSFTDDQFAGETFDYFLTNPPFGVDWKKQQKEIQQEHDKRGFDGRFGAGLPRVNDGSLLFLQHMVDKFEPVRPAEHKHGSRLASVVRRSSPVARAQERATSGSGSSKTTGSKPSSPCRSRCSTTPASAPTSGSSPTARRGGAKARSNSSLRTGDLLVCEGGEVGRTAIWAGALAECYFQKAVHRLRPITENDEPRFFRYFMRMASESGVFAQTTASTIQHLTAEKLRVVRYPAPPSEQQRAIADYLDPETARLDALVAAKERVLVLLTEKRRALITRAVTRGFDPCAPTRDSGILWLGEIPAHWEIWRLGHAAFVGNGSTPNRDNPEYWTEGTIPWLNSSVVNQEEVTASDQFVTTTALRQCHLPLVRPGSVLVGITGQGKTRGRAVILSFEATINQHIAFITPVSGRLDAWFLRWAMFAAYEFLRSISDDAGGTKGALTCEEVAALRVPVPPIADQHTIVELISNEIAKLDAMHAAIERTIDLLKERRGALIAAAVTGQLKVA